MEKQVTDYIKSLSIPVSLRYVRRLIASHPDYPSLLSASDVLEQLGIPHGVARLEKEQLKTLSYPYIMHVKNGGGEFLIIRGEEDLTSKPDLLDDWNGIVLKAEAPESIEDEENREVLAKEKAGRFAFSLFIFSVLVMAAMSWVPGFNWLAILLLATSIAGVVLGYLLVAKDLGVKYDAVESFCNAGQKTNCDRVLRSDEATLFGHFSLSDAVLSYFTAQLIVSGLLIPLGVNATSLWWVLAAVGILMLPVVVYSLWLQGAKFKTWCRLCLLVGGVLVLQAGLFGWMATAGVFGMVDGSIWAGGLVAGLFFAIGSLVFLLKIRLKEGAEAEQTEAEANRVKYNPSVFTHLLLQQPQADCTQFDKELLIGNPKAPVKITMAASLSCSPCKDGFEKAKLLVNKFPGMVNLSVRLSVPKNGNGQEPGPGRYFLWYWMKQVYNTNDQTEQTEKLLQDWFELADLNAFRERYPFQTNGHDSELETLTDRHTAWFDKAGIKGTPTFFVNGYKLPGQYRVEDLKYLMMGLSEQMITDPITWRLDKEKA